jgi:hypothetical protein
MGTMMALPLLEGMFPLSALAASPKARPNRMAFLFVPNGINMEFWVPKTQGAGFAMPETLAPLAHLRNSLNVLTGLAQDNASGGPDGPGDHARSTAVWLTGVRIKKTAGSDIRNGPSADQVAAIRIGNKTRFASLELGCERGGQSGDCDSGYSCAYSSNISWRNETTPTAKEVNPRLVFERLFGTGEEGEDAASRYRRSITRQSVLDFVSDDAAVLRTQLGTRDQRKLDEYFTSVREIEERLIKFEKTNQQLALSGIARPAGIPNDYGEHIRLMGDMMILAFQADLTRVCTLMFANDGSNRPFRMINVNEGHHDISHHGNEADKLEKKKKIDRWQVEQLAYILNKMQATQEVEGTLLDNSMIVFGAGISDGNRHNHDDLPILFAGKGGGTVKTGRHLVYPAHTPMNNLFLSMLDRMGVPTETLGNSTGKLQHLF